MHIRALIIRIILSTTTLPLFILGAILVWQGYLDQQEDAIDLQRETAYSAATQLTALIGHLSNEMELVVRTHQSGMDDYAAWERELNLLQLFSPIFHEVSVIDGSGNEQVRISRHTIFGQDDLRNFDKSAVFVYPTTTGRVFYGPISFDATSGEPFMEISVPIVDYRTGRAEGVIRARLRLILIWEVLDRITGGRIGAAYVVDIRGRVIAHGNTSFVLAGSQAAIPGQDGIGRGLDNIRALRVAREMTLGEHTYFLVVETPLATAVSFTVNSILVLSFVFLAAIVTAVVLAYLLTRQIVRPIQSMASNAQAVATGDLSQRVPEQWSFEFKNLADAFNTMTQRLQESFESLERSVALRSSINERLQAEIEERQKAAAELKRSEQRFQRAIEHAPFPTMIHADNGEVLVINRIWTALTGYEPNELPTVTKWVNLAYGDRAEYVHRHIEKLYDLDDPLDQGEWTIRTKHGGTQRWNFRTAPLDILPDGRRVVISMAVDVTERNLALQRLQESEERFRTIAETIPVPLVVTRVVDNQPLFVNAQFCRVHNITQEQAMSANGLQHIVDTEQRAQIGQRLMQDGHVHGIELFSQRLGGGSAFWLSLSIVPIQFNGQSALFSAFVDISERIESEKQLRSYAHQLASSNAELERFAYIASHDLQEPLRMVTSYLQLLQRRYRKTLDEDADVFIDYAVDGANRMKTLIQDLLAYSRLTTRTKPFAETDCETIMEAVLSGLQVAIQESNAEITYDPLPTLIADRSQLIQLFQNLISNAIKFHGDQCPQIHIGVEKLDDHWRFSVSDNGIGIAPEYNDRIFAVFQRLHSIEEYSGTGIGLAICKRVVERHQGTIWFKSEPGQGATFYFTISDTLSGVDADEEVEVEAEATPTVAA